MAQGLLVIGVSRSHSDTPHSVRVLWTSQQPVAETATNITHQSEGIDIHVLARFEPVIPASGRSQTLALDRVATGIGIGSVCDIRWYVWYADSLLIKAYRLLPRYNTS